MRTKDVDLMAIHSFFIVSLLPSFSLPYLVLLFLPVAPVAIFGVLFSEVLIFGGGHGGMSVFPPSLLPSLPPFLLRHTTSMALFLLISLCFVPK